MLVISGGNFSPNYHTVNAKSDAEIAIPDHEINYKIIDRKEKLTKFLQKRNSPLVNNVDTFIETADKYGLDYRFLPAVACLESSCGLRLIPNSHNPFGWGVYGNNHIAFESYDVAIQKVGEGIHKGYILKGADTIEKIAPIYNPPNHAKWLANVKNFMNQIDNS